MNNLLFLIFIQSGLLMAQGNWVNNKAPFDYAKTFKYKEITLLDEKKLNLQNEFTFVQDFNLDQSGNLYFVVYDRVIVCSPEGKILRELGGKRGQGPGELQNPPSDLSLDQEKNLWISDGYKYVKWDQRGNSLLNRLFIEPGQLVFTRTHIAWLHHINEGYQSFWTISVFPTGGGKKKSIFHSLAKNSLGNKNNSIISFYSHDYIPMTYLCLTGDDTLCFGDNQEYKVYLADGQGMIKGGFSVAEKAKPVTAEEIEVLKTQIGGSNDPNYARNMPKPNYRPYYRRLLGDEKGRIWVVCSKDCRDRSLATPVDIFDSRGVWLYHFTLPWEPQLIRDGIIYGVERIEDKNDDEIYHRVKKLVITDYSTWKY